LRLLTQKDSEAKSQYDLLTSIPGINEVTAIGLIANLPDISKFKCAKQLAAFAGLNPSINEFGSSVRGLRSISKTGSQNLRNILFMPALVSKKGGRPKAISDEKKQAILEVLNSGLSKAAVCRPFNVKRTTLYDAIVQKLLNL
jgi:transposase